MSELLKPRYKVIAGYPGSKFKIGDILYWHNTGESGFGNNGFYSLSSYYDISVSLYPPGDIESFPHIFKPLAWYEDREASEMPEYVKEYEPLEGGGGITYVYKKGKDFKYLAAANCIGIRLPNDKRMIHYQYLQPATETEYNQYLKTKQK